MADYSKLVHTPTESAAQYVRWAEHIKSEPGVQWGVPAIDEIVIPMRGGDMVAYIGRPGAGKSTMMARQARAVANDILDRGAEDEEIVVHITYEQIQEEIENFYQSSASFSSTDVAWGRVPIERIKKNAIKRARLPIWIIGHSWARAGEARPKMTVSVVLDAIRWIEKEYNVKVRLIVWDYMQLVPVAGVQDKTRAMEIAVPMVKELSLEISAPSVIGVQAGREVDSLKFKIPEMRHCQHASAIEQGVDKAFSFWRPWTTEAPDTTIDLGSRYGGEQPISENMLIVAMLKQRFGIGRRRWPMFFDPAYLKLEQLDIEHAPYMGSGY